MPSKKKCFLSNKSLLIKTIREDRNWHNTEESQDFEILSLPGPNKKTIAHLVLRCNQNWIHTEAASRDDVLSLTGEIGRTVAEFLIDDHLLPNDHKLLNDKSWLSKIYYGHSTFAHIIASRSSLWGESNPAAQDFSILTLGRGRPDHLSTVAHVLARWNHSWGLTAAAQNLNVLKLTDINGVSVAHVLAEFNKSWVQTDVAFEKSILSIVDDNHKSVASILCSADESWIFNAIGKTKSIFIKYGYRISRVIASNLPDFFNFHSVFSLDEVKKDSSIPVNQGLKLIRDESQRTIITSMSFKNPALALDLCIRYSSFYTNNDCVTGMPIIHILALKKAFTHAYFFEKMQSYHLVFDIYRRATLLEVFLWNLDESIRLEFLKKQIASFKKYENYSLNDTRQLYFETLIKISAIYDENWIYSEYSNDDYFLTKRYLGGTIAHFLAATSIDWLSTVGLLNNEVLFALSDYGKTVVEEIYDSKNWPKYQGTYDICSLNLTLRNDIKVIELVCSKRDWNYTLVDGYAQLFPLKLSSSLTVGEAILESDNVHFNPKHIMDCNVGFSWFHDLLSSDSWRSSLESPAKLSKTFSVALSSFYSGSCIFADSEFLKLINACLPKLDFDAIDESLSMKLLCTEFDGVPLYKTVLNKRGISGSGCIFEAVILDKFFFENFDIGDGNAERELYDKLRDLAKICTNLSTGIH